MKKYMIPLLALTLIAGVSHGQVSDKKPVAKTTTTKPVVHKATASVTPGTTAEVKPTATAKPVIKRRHPKKTGKAKKMETK